MMKEKPMPSKDGWLQCSPSDIPNCFEQWDSKSGTPKRITAIVYQLSDDFLEAIKELTTFNSTTCLSLEMAIDPENKLISPYFEFKSPIHEVPVRLFEHNKLTNTVYSPTKGSALSHRGVSVNYRNELCLNWGALPYANMCDTFYAPVQYGDLSSQGKESYLYLDGPQRVRRFVIPGTDLEALSQVLKKSSSSYIAVHFGISNLSNGQLGVPFNPIIEVIATKMKMKSSAEGGCIDDYEKIADDPDSSLIDLDFVNACPPFCCGAPGQPPCPPD